MDVEREMIITMISKLPLDAFRSVGIRKHSRIRNKTLSLSYSGGKTKENKKSQRELNTDSVQSTF